MNESVLLLFSIFFPILTGLVLLLIPKWENRTTLCIYTGVSLVVTAALIAGAVFTLPPETDMLLFRLTEKLPIYLKIDETGKLFVSIVTIVWLATGFFSFEYMKHEKKEKRYYGFFLIVYGVLAGLDFAGNMITFYAFYECMTLLSMPLVLHTGTREAILAGLKYLFYSFCGAYLVLFGLYFLYHYADSITFTAGGTLSAGRIGGHTGLLLVVAFLMIVGFGVKAGMFPLHAWLTAAHPVAPAPASAALSGIIVKAGVLGIVRVIYYLFGTQFIRGTWVQTVWMTLTLITVFMGSMMAYREKGWKKRLAYSTVSQISYILFGLSLLNPVGFTGALLHTVFHAFIKTLLFLTAGAVIYQTGRTKVDELRGIGKEMPVTIWCYTLASLALIGIPPASGFVSKWYLAIGSLETGIPVFSWLGPVVLLISALLTAGYLLPITIKGFFPGNDYDYQTLQKKEPVKMMLLPMLVLAALVVVPGMIPKPLITYISTIIYQVM